MPERGLPDEAAAREDAAWRRFLQALAAQLADDWPALRERLAERHEAFVEHAAQQALARGIDHAAGIARWVNLCVVWGPSFHERPGFEWARGLLAAPRARAWATLHQLVQRSLAELKARPDARIEPAALAAADARLIERFAGAGRHGAMHRPQPEPLPRAACDIEAVELRMLEGPPPRVYALQGDEWERVPLPALPPLRLSLAHLAPARVGLLSPEPAHGAAARLQVRVRAHAVCDGDRHPAIGFGGVHGLWQWRGHETRAVSWPVEPLALPAAPAAIAEETTPAHYRLDIDSCGLRDEGDALASQRLPVSVWPATQWWLELQRQAPAAHAVAMPAQTDAPRGVTRCRVEADGTAQDATALEQAFVHGLDSAIAGARQRLLQAWQAVPGLSHAELEGALGLLLGRAALSWGWCPGRGGLDGPALMRVRGRLGLRACSADLHFGGELALGDARARLQLRIAGDAALEHEVQRERDDAPLLNTVLPLVTRFVLPVQASLDPLAGAAGELLQAAGAAAGALVGEAGLRPRTAGGSGWEWFAALRLDAVSLPLRRVDPFLGDSSQTLTLLPALALFDWSAG